MTATAIDIPLLSIKAQNQALLPEIRAAVNRVLESGAFILGRENKAFDLEFAEMAGARYALGVDSGTSALELALEAIGVGPGDEVIVPTYTFIATATAVSVLGARPVFADVDDDTLTLDPASVERLITKKTKAIVAVHIFGQPADIDPLLTIGKTKHLHLVEDCAQSHLATYKGRPAGSLGEFGAYSFYPTKNLGAAGDAGAVVTNDEASRDRVIELRNCGRAVGATYAHARVGHNCRLDEIQAAILRVKMLHLKSWTQSRRRLAGLYCKRLKDLPLRLPPMGASGTEPVFHLFTVRCGRRDALAAHLKRHAVGCGVYYPLSVHLQPAYAALGGREGQLPVAERASRETLCLPMFPELSDAEHARVCDAVRGFFQ
ncbi:MAG: DegT/DnrJ/EryC1/StrS family aminotransferase [Elusimicrobiota bacterium]